MIATLIALALVAGPPGGPKPPTANRTVAKPGPSTTAKPEAAKAEAARKKQDRNRLRALNSRRLAGMDGPAPNFSGAANPGGFGGAGGPNPAGSQNFGGYSADAGGYSGGAGGYGNIDSSTFGGGYGGFGGGSADPGPTSSFEQQLAATFVQTQAAQAAGQAAAAAIASLS